MPTPRSDESENEFMARCIPMVIEDGAAESREQAIAICASFWEEGPEGSEMRIREFRREDGTYNYKSIPTYQTKTLPTFVKNVDQKQGIVDHIIAVFGNLDDGGDVIEPGAFTKTISERGRQRIKVLDQHATDSVTKVVGRPLALREIRRDELPSEVLEWAPEATGGLLATTQYATSTTRGRDVFNLIDGGFLPETSFGYDAVDVEFEERMVDGKTINVRHLKQVRLWEYSNVIWGMNRATTTISAKELETMDDKGATGSTTLPIADRDRAWDATAAQGRVRTATDSTEEPSARYRNAFFWFDAQNADQFGAYKLPFADVINGRLTAIPRGIFAVAQRLGMTDIPAADKAGVRNRVSTYYRRMREKFDDDSIMPPWEKGKGLSLTVNEETGELMVIGVDAEGKHWKQILSSEEAVKIGRTISAATGKRISQAVMALIELLEDAGVDIPGIGRTVTEEPTEDEGKTITYNLTINMPSSAPDRAAQEKDQDRPSEQAGPGEPPTSDEEMLASVDQILSELDKLEV